jgi:tetratricopeptide (TPR) repeat protein
MRNILILLLLANFCHAQQPEYVYGYAVQRQSTDWYNQQVKAWKAELDKNKSNGYAWYNYYRANRNLIRTDTNDKRPHEEKVAVLKNIIEDMGKAAPESFEYNVCKWMDGGNDYEHCLPYLKKAVELDPDRHELFQEVIVWAEVDRDLKKRNQYSDRYYHSEMASPGLLYYNYNTIIGLKPNAIILTTGDNDTYPIWMLQSQGIRTDITLLNISLLYIDVYRDKIFKELGIARWDMKDIGPDTTNCDEKIQDRFQSQIVTHIAKNSTKRPVYIALTASDNFIKPIESNLYLTGLAYEYSEKNIDNIALLKKNIEQHFALDYIDKPFFNDISVYYTKHTLSNYIVPMLKLYDHYKESGDSQKMEWIRKKIVLIVKDTPQEKETLTYLNK